MRTADPSTIERRIALGPYQGLTFFTEADTEFFFGRTRWRDVIVANLQARRLTVLYGPSGVGKSSLLRAGVLPELGRLARRNEALEFVPVYFNSWQTEPKVGLSSAIRAAVKDHAGRITSESDSMRGLIEQAGKLAAAPLLIILDQFEDYWTYAGLGAREPIATTNGSSEEASFALELASTINAGVSAHFLISLREDSLAQLDRTFRLGIKRLLDHRLSLTPLSRAEGEMAIREPLTRFSDLIDADPPLGIEDRLVEAVLDQVRIGNVTASKAAVPVRRNAGQAGDAIEAPYLQLVMRKLWEREQGRGSQVLRFETLEDLGGAEKIVTTHVESALADRSPAEQDAIADLLRYLVSPSQTKIALTVEDLTRFTERPQEQVRSLLTVLADENRRIVRPVGNGGESRYEIFHDVLAAPLLEWASARERLRAENAERSEARERGAKRVLALVVVAAVVAIAFILINNAKQQKAVAQSEQLAARATQLADVGLASLYALESYSISPTEDARSAILQVAASHQIGTPLAASDGGVAAVAWSPGGTTVATGGEDGWLRLLDARTHRELAAIPPPGLGAALAHVPHLGIVGSNIGAVAFSPDGRHIAYGRNIEFFGPPPAGQRTVIGTVHLWDLRTHRQTLLATGKDVPSRVNTLAFDRRGTRLAAGYGMLGLASKDYTVRLWSLRGRPAEQAMRRHTGPVNSVAFSRRGNTIASSSCDQGDHDNHSPTNDDTVLLWTPGYKRVPKLQAKNPVCSVAFSPDDKLLATAGDDHAVTLWSVRRRQPIEPPFVGDSDVINAVAFSPTGTTLASASRDHSVRLWDVASHRQIGSPLANAGAVGAVAFNPRRGTLASASSDGVRVFTAAAPYDLRVEHTAGYSPVYDIAFSPQGNLVAWFDDHAWPRSQETVPSQIPGKKPIGGTIYIWDPRAQRLLDVIRAPTDNISSLAFGPGGRTLVWAASADQRVWVWNVWRHSRRERSPAVASSGAALIERVAVAPDGNTIAFGDMVGESATIHVWNTAQQRVVSLPLGKVGSINALAFSPDGRLLASAGTDGKVRLWELSNHRQIASFEGRTISGAVPSAYALAFSPDGQTLVSGGGDGSITFWNVASHHEVGAPLTEHTAAVYGLTVSRDGKTLASASLDGTVRLWDMRSKRALLTLTGHTSDVYGVAFRKNGNEIASAGADGTIRFWGNLSVPAAINRLCNYLNLRTAPNLWHRIEPSIGYQSPCR